MQDAQWPVSVFSQPPSSLVGSDPNDNCRLAEGGWADIRSDRRAATLETICRAAIDGDVR